MVCTIVPPPLNVTPPYPVKTPTKLTPQHPAWSRAINPRNATVKVSPQCPAWNSAKDYLYPQISILLPMLINEVNRVLGLGYP